MEWWKSLFRKRALDAQLDSELRCHIEELTEANIAAGLTPEEARRRAVLEFGGREQIKEELRDVHRISIVESTLANLKSAFRYIRKAPSFSITVILTLALGIGANSAVFSAIDAILLRPLPFPNGDQLMELRQYNPKMKSPRTRLAPVRLEDWNRMNSTFQAITGYYSEDNSETSGALPEKVTQAFVAPRFLQVWGISPALGRDFNTEEERFGGPNAILISDRFWRRRFGADPNALGNKLRINGYSSSIVGVMPASFLFPDRDVDVWSPGPPDAPIAQSREWTWYLAIGRLKPGVTLEQARAAQRQHEISVRFSLGGSRAAIANQLLTEVFVLAIAGAALGLVVANAASKVFRTLAADLPRVEEIRLDWRIVLQSRLCSVLATLVCGLFPAIRGTRRNMSSSLTQASRTQVSTRNPLQWLLVGVQVALAVTLLAGAGLLLRSFQELGRVSPGFDPNRVLTFHISASYAETADWKGLTQRIDRTIDSLGSMPGVETAATAGALPGIPSHYQMELKFTEGQLDPERKIVAESRFVSPGYFATMQIPLLSGELCRESPDSLKSINVLVNRSFANTYLAESIAVGHHLQEVPSSAFLPPGEIRGIVGDAREEGLNREPGPTVYWCTSAAGPDPFYLVRTRTDPMAMAETIRQKIHEIEPARSVFNITILKA